MKNTDTPTKCLCSCGCRIKVTDEKSKRTHMCPECRVVRLPHVNGRRKVTP